MDNQLCDSALGWPGSDFHPVELSRCDNDHAFTVLSSMSGVADRLIRSSSPIVPALHLSRNPEFTLLLPCSLRLQLSAKMAEKLEKTPIDDVGQADQTLKDIGEGFISGQGLTPEEDKRILRRIDMW